MDAGCPSPQPLVEPSSAVCNVPRCEKREVIAVHCKTCRRVFCLRHRNEMDHECKGRNSRTLPSARGRGRATAAVPVVTAKPSTAVRTARRGRGRGHTPARPTPPKECQVQVRLLDGTSKVGTFKPDAKLREVHTWIVAFGGITQFKLMTQYPRQVFDEAAFDAIDLTKAGLVPNGTVIVTL